MNRCFASSVGSRLFLALLLGWAGALSAQEAPVGPPAPPPPAPPPASYTMTPPSWDMGEVDQGRLYTQTFRIESEAPGFEAQVARTSTPLIQTQLVRLSEKDKSAWQLTCQFNSGSLEGGVDEFVFLTTTDKNAPLLKLPIRGKVRAGQPVDGVFFFSTKPAEVIALAKRLDEAAKKRSLKIPAMYTGDEGNFVQQIRYEMQFQVRQGNPLEFYCGKWAFLGFPQIDHAIKALEGEEADWQKAVATAFDDVQKAIAAAQAAQANAAGAGAGQNPVAAGGQGAPPVAGDGGPKPPAPGGGQVATSQNFQNEIKEIGAATGAPVKPESTPKGPTPAPVTSPTRSPNPGPADSSPPPENGLVVAALAGVVLLMLYQSFLLKEISGRLGK